MTQPPVAAGDTLVTSQARYTLVKRLGSGMAGTVHEATDQQGRRHAIKILTAQPTDFQARGFRNEVMFGYRKLHPGIITVEDDGSVGDVPFFVMPFYWTTLRQVIGPGLSPIRALRYFGQARAAIGAAHRAGISHRDVKPENLLIGSDDELVVADWGTADFDAPARHANLPPEVRARLAGRGTHGTAADIYALGLLLIELFTGVPFDADAPRAIGEVAPGFAYLDDLAATMLTDRNRIAYLVVG